MIIEELKYEKTKNVFTSPPHTHNRILNVDELDTVCGGGKLRERSLSSNGAENQPDKKNKLDSVQTVCELARESFSQPDAKGSIDSDTLDDIDDIVINENVPEEYGDWFPSEGVEILDESEFESESAESKFDAKQKAITNFYENDITIEYLEHIIRRDIRLPREAEKIEILFEPPENEKYKDGISLSEICENGYVTSTHVDMSLELLEEIIKTTKDYPKVSENNPIFRISSIISMLGRPLTEDEFHFCISSLNDGGGIASDTHDFFVKYYYFKETGKTNLDYENQNHLIQKISRKVACKRYP